MVFDRCQRISTRRAGRASARRDFRVLVPPAAMDRKQIRPVIQTGAVVMDGIFKRDPQR